MVDDSRKCAYVRLYHSTCRFWFELLNFEQFQIKWQKGATVCNPNNNCWEYYQATIRKEYANTQFHSGTERWDTSFQKYLPRLPPKGEISSTFLFFFCNFFQTTQICDLEPECLINFTSATDSMHPNKFEGNSNCCWHSCTISRYFSKEILAGVSSHDDVTGSNAPWQAINAAAELLCLISRHIRNHAGRQARDALFSTRTWCQNDSWEAVSKRFHGNAHFVIHFKIFTHGDWNDGKCNTKWQTGTNGGVFCIIQRNKSHKIWLLGEDCAFQSPWTELNTQRKVALPASATHTWHILHSLPFKNGRGCQDQGQSLTSPPNLLPHSYNTAEWLAKL